MRDCFSSKTKFRKVRVERSVVGWTVQWGQDTWEISVPSTPFLWTLKLL